MYPGLTYGRNLVTTRVDASSSAIAEGTQKNEIAIAAGNILRILGEEWNRLTSWWKGTPFRATIEEEPILSINRQVREELIRQIANKEQDLEKRAELRKDLRYYLNRRYEASYTAPTLSEKQSIPTNGLWNDSCICGTGTEVILSGVSGNGTQQIAAFNLLNNATVAFNATLSNNLNINFSYGNQSIFVGNRTSISCTSPNVYNIITNSPGIPGETYYALVANGFMQFSQGLISATPASQGKWAWRPVSLSGFNISMPMSNDSITSVLTSPMIQTSYALPYHGGSFNVLSESYLPPTGSTDNSLANQLLSYVDGSFEEFFRNASGLFSRLLDMTQTSYGEAVNLQLPQEIFNQTLGAPFPVNTPVDKNNYPFTLLMDALKNGSVVRHIYDTATRQLISSQVLPGALVNPKLSIANCPDNPSIYLHARDDEEIGAPVIRFDAVNVGFNSISLFGGEQVYTNLTSLNPPNSQIGCFVNATGIITLSEDGNYSFVSFNMPPPPAPVQAPTMSPTSTPVSSPVAPGIEVTVPPTLGPTPIPLTQVITINGNFTTITVVDPQGFNIIFNNGTAVPINTPIPVTLVPTLEISKGNAGNGDAPVFQGCDANDDCVTSTTLLALFVSNENWKIAVPVSLGGLAVVAIIGGLVYKFYYRPLQKQRIERYGHTNQSNV